MSLHPLLLSPNLGSAFRAAPEGRGPCFSSAVSCPRCSASEQSGQERALSRPRGYLGAFPSAGGAVAASPLQDPLWKGLCQVLSCPRHLREMLLGFAVVGGEISACSPGFAHLEEWILEHLLPGVVPPQGIVVKPPRLQGFAPGWVGGVLGGGSEPLHPLISENPLWT